MNLVRKYKVSKLLNKQAEGKEGEYISFIVNYVKGISAFQYKDYVETYYIDANNNALFYHDEDTIYINYTYYRTLLEVQFGNFGFRKNELINFEAFVNLLSYGIKRILKVKYRYAMAKVYNDTNDIKDIEKAFKKKNNN